MIKNIIFDLCGPIIDIDVRRIDQALSRYGVQGERPYRSLYDSGLAKQFDSGLVTPEDFADRARLELHSDFPDQLLWDALEDVMTCFDLQHVDTIRRLRDKGFRTYILSNSNIVSARYFVQEMNRRAGFDFMGECFEHVFFSHQLGCRKPEPEVFAKVLQLEGLKADETLFVDDHEKNCLAAAAQGLHNHHLLDTESIELLAFGC